MVLQECRKKITTFLKRRQIERMLMNDIERMLMNDQEIELASGFRIPLVLVKILLLAMKNAREERPGDFLKLQQLVKKDEISSCDAYEIHRILFGQDRLDKACVESGFFGAIEKLAPNLYCFFDDSGNLRDIKEIGKQS